MENRGNLFSFNCVVLLYWTWWLFSYSAQWEQARQWLLPIRVSRPEWISIAFCGDVSVSLVWSCRLLEIWKRKKRNNEKILTFLHMLGKSHHRLLVPGASRMFSGPGVPPEAVQKIWRGSEPSVSRGYHCVQPQGRQGWFSAHRNLLSPANRTLFRYFSTDVVEFVWPNRKRF